MGKKNILLIAILLSVVFLPHVFAETGRYGFESFIGGGFYEKYATIIDMLIVGAIFAIGTSMGMGAAAGGSRQSTGLAFVMGIVGAFGWGFFAYKARVTLIGEYGIIIAIVSVVLILVFIARMLNSFFGGQHNTIIFAGAWIIIWLAIVNMVKKGVLQNQSFFASTFQVLLPWGYLSMSFAAMILAWHIYEMFRNKTGLGHGGGGLGRGPHRDIHEEIAENDERAERKLEKIERKNIFDEEKIDNDMINTVLDEIQMDNAEESVIKYLINLLQALEQHIPNYYRQLDHYKTAAKRLGGYKGPMTDAFKDEYYKVKQELESLKVSKQRIEQALSDAREKLSKAEYMDEKQLSEGKRLMNDAIALMARFRQKPAEINLNLAKISQEEKEIEQDIREQTVFKDKTDKRGEQARAALANHEINQERLNRERKKLETRLKQVNKMLTFDDKEIENDLRKAQSLREQIRKEILDIIKKLNNFDKGKEISVPLILGFAVDLEKKEEEVKAMDTRIEEIVVQMGKLEAMEQKIAAVEARDTAVNSKAAERAARAK